MPEEKRTERIAIIGAGIAGPALALFLKRAGFAPALYEAYGPDSGAGGGFQIAPNGMAVLDQLGLAQALLAESMPADWIQFETSEGRQLARFENGPAASYGTGGVVASRSALHRLLAEALQAQGIPVHYHHRLHGLRQAVSGVCLDFEGGHEVETDLLIGADGIHSPTRAAIFPKASAPVFTGQLNIGGFATLERSLDAEGTTHMVFGPGHFIGFSRVDQRDPRRYMWWCNVPADQAWTREVLAEQSNEAFLDELLAQCQGWAAPVPELLRCTDSLVRTNTLTLPPLKAWSTGRAILIGDAAHGLDPASGQGASLALEDAFCLARLLRDQPFEQALIRFERERRPRVETIALSAKRRASSKGKLGPVGIWLRDFMMSKLVPGMAVKEQRQIFSYRLSWG